MPFQSVGNVLLEILDSALRRTIEEGRSTVARLYYQRLETFSLIFKAWGYEAPNDS